MDNLYGPINVSRKAISSEAKKLVYTDPNTGIKNVVLKLKDFPVLLRPRSEILVLKDDKVFMSFESKFTYRVPGGNWEIDETPTMAAKRECQEEAHINVKNIKWCGDYYTIGNVSPWVAENVPKLFQWGGYYTDVFVAEYDSEYTGHVDERDEDKFIASGDFYNKNLLSSMHLSCIERYAILDAMINLHGIAMTE